MAAFGQTIHDAPPGATADFFVTASGAEPFEYQWRKDGAAIIGATHASFKLSNLQPDAGGIYDVIVSNFAGAISSRYVTLKVRTSLPNSPPTISSQPIGRSATLGENLAFTVTANAGSDGVLTYQWRRNGVNLTGATASTLSLSAVTDRDFGAYTVLVSSLLDSTLSHSVYLTRLDAPVFLPIITRQPAGVSTTRNGILALSVAAYGNPEPVYQWRHEGIDLRGATASTLVLENAGSGAYTVSVGNSAGAVVSVPAVVTVGNGLGRHINFSARGLVGVGANIVITGFVISGPLPKQLLIRAVGPTLAEFSVTEALADPALEIFNASGQLIQSNDNWGSAPSIAGLVRTATGRVGAFGLANGSRDAALVVTLNPGAHTIKTTGNGDSIGVAIAEIYDLDAMNPAGSRLTNLSTRAFVGAAHGILISGFVIEGTVARTVLVRAIGPALAGFGVSGSLAQPQLSVFDGARRLVDSNIAWESAGASDKFIAISARVGAFALPRGSADSCLFATLGPGNYTAQISGANNGSGIALLEIYDVP